MPSRDRITVTLPADIVQEMDRLETNRSRFVLDAVRREIHRRRREELRKSLANPHPESAETEALGFSEWAEALPAEDVSELVNLDAGTPIQWIPGRGWVERRS